MRCSSGGVWFIWATAARPVRVYRLAELFYWVAGIVLGIPPIVVPSHGLAVFGTAATQHVNIRLPEFFEHWLQPVRVITDMHHIHHPIEFSRITVRRFDLPPALWHPNPDEPRQHEKIIFGVREFGVRDLAPRDCLKPSAMLLTPRRLARAVRTATRKAA